MWDCPAFHIVVSGRRKTEETAHHYETNLSHSSKFTRFIKKGAAGFPSGQQGGKKTKSPHPDTVI
jgi:hypothetical protein